MRVRVTRGDRELLLDLAVAARDGRADRPCDARVLRRCERLESAGLLRVVHADGGRMTVELAEDWLERLEQLRPEDDPLCAAIRRARVAAGLSQREAADRAGVSVSQLSAWERHQRPRLERLRELEGVYGLPIGTILADAGFVDPARLRA